MSLSKLKLSLAAAAACFIALSLSGAEESPVEDLKTAVADVIEILYLPEAEADIDLKREKVLKVMNEDFSFDIMIQSAFGRNWRNLTPDQRESIKVMMTDILVRAFTTKFKDIERPELTYGKPKELSATKLSLPCTVKIQGMSINLEYSIGKFPGGWQVYDIIVENTSLVANYRSQFTRHFRTKGVDELEELLKNKLQDL